MSKKGTKRKGKDQDDGDEEEDDEAVEVQSCVLKSGWKPSVDSVDTVDDDEDGVAPESDEGGVDCEALAACWALALEIILPSHSDSGIL